MQTGKAQIDDGHYNSKSHVVFVLQVASTQLILTHAACVWTNSESRPQRRMLAQREPLSSLSQALVPLSKLDVRSPSIMQLKCLASGLAWARPAAPAHYLWPAHYSMPAHFSWPTHYNGLLFCSLTMRKDLDQLCVNCVLHGLPLIICADSTCCMQGTSHSLYCLLAFPEAL